MKYIAPEIINSKVYRLASPWSEQVHSFLCFLRHQGFAQAPVPLGFDEKGREILSYIKGRTHDSEDEVSLKSLISGAKLLRSLHDKSQRFLIEGTRLQGGWMFPSRNPLEVICHNDFAPYNICFQEQEAMGVIDFDTAHPGPRIWDIAYALYRFAPFSSLGHASKFDAALKTQILRARIFCDAYGLEEDKRVGLVGLVIERLQNLLDFLQKSAQQGDEKYELNIQDGHHLEYLRNIEYIILHKVTIQDGLL